MENREIDALIAEKVMGWVQIPHPDPSFLFPGVKPGFSWFPSKNFYGANKDKVSQGLANGVEFPEYSTDIAAAWDVVEMIVASINDLGENFGIECIEGRWRAGKRWFSNEDGWTFLPDCPEADSAPLAICLEALRAVGHPIQPFDPVP